MSATKLNVLSNFKIYIQGNLNICFLLFKDRKQKTSWDKEISLGICVNIESYYMFLLFLVSQVCDDSLRQKKVADLCHSDLTL